MCQRYRLMGVLEAAAAKRADRLKQIDSQG